MQIDDKLKGLLKELGDAINGALSQSVEINDAIQNVRNAGYEVVLALEATIGTPTNGAIGEMGDGIVGATGKLDGSGIFTNGFAAVVVTPGSPTPSAKYG